MARRLNARLSSNGSSTPIRVQQDRGLRETYAKAALSGRHGRHEWKIGGDAVDGGVREQFAYTITDVSQFETGTPLAFNFSGRGSDQEQSVFAQDRMSLGPWTASAGMRFDRYQFIVRDWALSPRVAIAWSRPAHDLVARASYDRAFQTPSFENLLLASSPAVETLSPHVARLPVPPSRGNFYEAGITKGLFGTIRVDVSAYRRQIGDFADDDVLLNTGVTFPIAFRKADIRGSEVKVNLPPWKRISGFLSYANMYGVGYLPVHVGLLLGDEVSALESSDRFVVTQDQRNTASGRVMYDISDLSLGLSAMYGSGLPVEVDLDEADAVEQFGARVVNRVDLERGRVKSALTLDASVRYSLGGLGRRFRVQADVVNLTNQLRVINFAGLFSGTAIGAPRSVTVRIQAGF
jgi:outer membrane receptor for Fe3+-dicitrate